MLKRLLAGVRAHSQAIGLSDVEPFEAILLAMLLEIQKEVEALKEAFEGAKKHP